MLPSVSAIVRDDAGRTLLIRHANDGLEARFFEIRELAEVDLAPGFGRILLKKAGAL